MAQPTIPEYIAARERFLSNPSLCDANRHLFRRFFEFQEYKLKRKNQLAALDAGCLKTLFGYIQKLRNVNLWFENKPLVDLTETDIRRVYDGLEDGTIVTQRGARFKDRNSYYGKVFKSKLFEMAGKRQLAEQVIQFNTPSEATVRFVLEDDVRKIASFVHRRDQRLLVWLAFDIGENVQSLLRLTASDFTRQINPHTGDPEYRVRLRRELLKRTRTPRSEITLYRETVELLDTQLQEARDGDFLFWFGHRAGWEWLKRAAREAGVRCQPTGVDITWKDLRSGMACDLLRKGWSRDEINARLGHKPSSKEIDKYINFFALDRHQPKAKADEFQLRKLEEKLQQKDARERLILQRMTTSEEQVAYLSARVRELTIIIQRQTCPADVEQAIAIKKGLAGSGLELNDVN